jgi:sugar lactone lactonase YvrE
MKVRVVVGVVVLVAAYLLLWPVSIDPVAWQPAPAPALEGPYATNGRLKDVEWLGKGVAMGPESTAIDRQGRVYTGTRDGRILAIDPGKTEPRLIKHIDGRALGMAVDHNGRLVFCNPEVGLQTLDDQGNVTTLVSSLDNIKFRFTDDVDVAPDGTLYFTDASWKFGAHGYRDDILEHRGNGRLMAYVPLSGKTFLALSGLQFANGVAVAGDGSFVIVAETGAYRLTRFWLKGDKAGTADVFFDNLPGLPDNVTWSKERKVFWVALFSPRISSLDALAPHPFLRKVIMRLPLWLQPQPKRTGWALAIDADGKVVDSLEYSGDDAFAPVTSVREHEGVLWLGSLEREALGRIKAPPLLAADGGARGTTPAH